MVISILAICIPLAFLAGGFVALKAVQLGLKWQIQTAKEEQPTLEVKNPVKEYVEKKQQVKQTEEQASILDEYLNGPKESR